MKYADYLTALDNYNLFCPAVKAQIVKQHLLDGVLGQHWNSQRLRNPDGDGALAAGGHTGNQAYPPKNEMKDCPDTPRVFSR